MSYARFGWEGSDVYVFLNVHGYFECCGCWMEPPPETNPESGFGMSFTCKDTQGMIDHLRKHEEEGHTVPDYTFERLEAEREENDQWIKGEGGEADE